MTARLDIDGLRVTYAGNPPVDALRGIDLSLRGGTVTALLGPNGAGKSTLVSSIVGIVDPTGGSMRLDGVDLCGPDGRMSRRRIGYAPQEEALYPAMTAGDNLRIFAELAGLRGAALARRIEHVSTSLLIDDLLDRPTRTLSGGQRRRLHNAIALLAEPEVVLLDEPTAGVDPSTRSAILEVVRGLAASGVAVAYATHYLPEVTALDAEIVMLDKGAVVARGKVDELLRAHAVPAVEVRFDGAPPAFDISDASVSIANCILRIESNDAPERVGEILELLGDHRHRLRGIDVVEPDLDMVFNALTGRRIADGSDGTDEADGAAET